MDVDGSGRGSQGLKTCRVSVSVAVLCAVGILTQALPVRADARYDWESLLNTRRIAVVAPFFCTVPPPAFIPSAKPTTKRTARVIWPKPASNTPSARNKPVLSHSKTSAGKTLQPATVQIELAPLPPKTTSAVPATAADKSFHTQTLQTLTSTLHTALPESIGAGNVYRVVPQSDVQAALGRLHWNEHDLFQERGQPLRGKFPVPDVKRIQKLAQMLHVDGVVVTAMREPASIGDGLRLPFELWKVNPFNMGVRRMKAHVLSPRVQAFLITAQGKTAWQDEMAADHPRTTPRTLKTLLVDWQEATEQVAQQLADSLHRQPPG